MEKEIEVVSYQELARRVGDMIMCNNITTIDENLYDNLENGELYYQEKDSNGELIDDYGKEIYQFYLINQNSADYLKRNTDEIIFYSDKLDLWVWGITHFGTSWSGVFTNVIYKE